MRARTALLLLLALLLVAAASVLLPFGPLRALFARQPIGARPGTQRQALRRHRPATGRARDERKHQDSGHEEQARDDGAHG